MKVLERVTNLRLDIHLESGNRLHPVQYGFWRGKGSGHSTETMTLHQSNGFRWNLVLPDVSKAFDWVWHLGLKNKILHLGLPAPVESLLCDFLDDWAARVRVGGHLVSATGILQGSVLFPTLYSIYTITSLSQTLEST